MVATSKDKKPAPATKRATNGATIFKLMVVALPLYPAIRINLDAAAGQGETWAIVGIGFVIFGALCIEHALHSIREKQAFSFALWGFLGLGFLALNLLNAIGNLAAHSDHSRDHFRAKVATIATISEQRSQMVAARSEMVAIAGNAAPESIEAEARALKAREARLWSASFQCDPQWITKDAMKAFCSTVAELDAKKAAAVKRDEIDAKLAKLDEKAETKGEAPSTVDSFADAMADGLNAFGYQVDEKGKLAIVRARDWGKAAGVELLAGFGPTALLLLFLRAGSHSGSHSRAAEEPQPRLVAKPQSLPRQKDEKAAPALPAGLEEAIPAPANDPVHGFVARRLEPAAGEMVAAGDLWKLWQVHCNAHGIEAGTQQAFGRNLKRRLAHDKNSGRPRYLNVRIKAENAPALRLAVVNS